MRDDLRTPPALDPTPAVTGGHISGIDVPGMAASRAHALEREQGLRSRPSRERGVKATVQRLASQVGEEAVAVADQRRYAFAARIDEVGAAVRRSGEELRDQQPWLADLVERGAGQIGRVADELRNNDVRASIRQVKAFAERQPAAFAGAALVAGFAVGRLVQIAFSSVDASQTNGMEVSYG